MGTLSDGLRHHWQCLIGSIGRLARAPLATLLNAIVIGAALALPLVGYSLVDSARTLATRVAGDAQMSVFMALDAKRPDLDRIEARLRAAPIAASVEFVSKDAGLEALKRHEGLGEVIATLKGNPLPDAFTVHLKRVAPAEVEAFATALRAEGKITHVQLDAVWLKRLDRFLGVGRAAVSLLALLLGLAFVAITFNTIRMQIVTRREEIAVSRLVGATAATIRRPFFYLGALTGLLGGLVAWGIAVATLAAFGREVVGLADLYGSSFQLGAVPLRRRRQHLAPDGRR